MFFLGTETPRPRRELLLLLPVVAAEGLDSSLADVFIERLRGASPPPEAAAEEDSAVAVGTDEEEAGVDVLGLPIRELTSSARGFPLTV